MSEIRLAEDIKPLSEFRANTAACLRQLKETGRVMVLTQRGHGAAVLLDVHRYQALMDELELLREIRLAEGQLAEGEGVPHEEALRRARASLQR
ncbi:MAG: type II toxin-antitoxin system Phd/YefM family antitoxin [Deltaproteobacteria bacterium]|nr:type II toxin-antitoxin system Phd/YefM family antitoxin [Deltaproteobacteria bacterium]